MDGRGRGARWSPAAGLSLVAWVLDGTIYWAVAQALGIGLAPAGGDGRVGRHRARDGVPSAPGYVGTFELAASAAAGWFGVAAEAPWRSRSSSTG